jgi:hypothetical protein
VRPFARHPGYKPQLRSYVCMAHMVSREERSMIIGQLDSNAWNLR